MRWWDLVLGTLGSLVVLLWLVGGLLVPGLVLLLLLVFAAASRITIVERQVAGAHARARALLALIRTVALLAILVFVAFTWLLDRRDWTKDTLGMIATLGLAGLAVYLMRDVARYADEAVDYFIGGRSERQVARVLEPLREQGWEIAHNIPREGRGNLDHFVSGPACAFAIETKSGKYRAADRGQAISNAVWAKEKFGKRFVTAVLCVGTDPPAEPRLELHGRSEVWVLGPPALRDWLTQYRWEPRRRA